MTNITACKDCKDCKYFEMIDKFYMKCNARDKKYMYGQTVPCEDRVKISTSKQTKSKE